MARPIRDTPALTGKEAIKFLSEMNKMREKKISPEELDKMKANSEKLRSIVKFPNGLDKS